jgi:hypothetical protein
MIAASMQGQSVCYSAVTTGNTWEFGTLADQVFIRDPRRFSATLNLQEVFDVVNWVFYTAKSRL